MASRRTFLKSAGLASLPLFLDVYSGLSQDKKAANNKVNFQSDGEYLGPEEYSKKLSSIVSSTTEDFYGRGGAVTALETAFAEMTGKPKAIFMPSGTMANQLAIKVLSGQNTKVFVQETSHVYRDEADAAQSVHNLRLIPLAKGFASFTLNELKEAIDYHNRGEVFKSGIGAISIENPVRRNDGQQFDLEEIKKISAYCKENNYRLHLDGARLHLAAAYSGISVKEYASYFDTVYISLYKYLGAAGGAILAGEANVIAQMPHLIKIHGGNTFQSWPYAAMALNSLKGLDERLIATKKAGSVFMNQLNVTKEFRVSPVTNGTNVFTLTIPGKIDLKKFYEQLKQQGIGMHFPDANGNIKLFFNETLLKRDVTQLVSTFLEAHTRSATS